jgi:UrcA family protein
MKSAIGSHSPSMTSVMAATLVALACIAGGGTAQASDADQNLTRKVSYGDLNLDTQEGAKALYARLRYAAMEVCSPLEARELNRHLVWERCVDGALSSAVGQINKPTVTALHDLKVRASRPG